MRKFLLLALLAGCGTSSPIDETTWSVQLGDASSVCQGTMTLMPNHTVEPRGMPPQFVGSWACGTFGGQASGSIMPDRSAFFDLETTPGYLNRALGTFTGNDVIGDITLNQQQVPFAAYRQ